MKITFILPGMGRSGGVKCTIETANRLIRRGHSVRLVAYRGQLISQLRDFYLGLCYRGSKDWIGLFSGKLEIFTDVSECKFEDGEVVIAAGLWAAREMARINRPWLRKVHYVHGVDLPDPWQMRQALSENVPKIVVASYLEKLIKDVCGQRVLAVIPNGINTTEYYPAVPEEERDGVGTIYGQGFHKDPDTVLAILDQLRQSDSSLPLRVFGACRRSTRIPRRQYRRLPSINQSREIYSRSLVWFLGSRSEGFPAPPLEAMACGCAVVATDCGGPRDIITDGENGFLVEVGNVKQIASRIKLLLDNAELRQKFVRKSRETVSKFSWDNSVNKLEKVLCSLDEVRHI